VQRYARSSSALIVANDGQCTLRPPGGRRARTPSSTRSFRCQSETLTGFGEGNSAPLARVLQTGLDRLANVDFILDIFPCCVVRQALGEPSRLFLYVRGGHGGLLVGMSSNTHLSSPEERTE